MDPAALAAAVVAGDVRAAARAISLVEAGGAGAQAVLQRLKGGQAAASVGLTGSPGVGKSTLAQALGLELLRRGARLAVLAIDPSSPFTGGALLGDRVRMPDLTARGAFVRSMASRGALGGVAGATSDAVDVLTAAGYDWIFIETVGVGQGEVDVAGEADTVVVVLTAGAGDDVQAAKAGLLEIADVLAVNKADRPGADEQIDVLQAMLALQPATDWTPPVLRVSAHSGEGIERLADAIAEHRRFLGGGARRDALRRRRARRRLERAFADLAWRRALAGRDGELEQTVNAVAAGALDPYTAAAELWRWAPREES